MCEQATSHSTRRFQQEQVARSLQAAVAEPSPSESSLKGDPPAALAVQFVMDPVSSISSNEDRLGRVLC